MAISTVRSVDPLSATMTSTVPPGKASSALSIAAAMRFSSFSVFMIIETVINQVLPQSGNR